jgi:hypothetical protein
VVKGIAASCDESASLLRPSGLGSVDPHFLGARRRLREPVGEALGLVAGAAAVDFLWLAPLYFLRLAGAREQLVLGVLVALGPVILLLLHSLPNDRGPR